MENIGKVKIDDTFYKGNESVLDTQTYTDLLRIARDCSKLEYPRIIEEKASWPYMYHLSPIRENIVRWLPIRKTDKVLEISAGCGEITGAICEMAASVHAIEGSKIKSQINAHRNSDKNNLIISVGKIQDIEASLDDDFDYVIMVGCLELAGLLIDDSNPYEELLTIAQKHLAPKGRIVIATENRLGLKYFAGNKESYTGLWFGGIDGSALAKNIKTFSKKALESLLLKTGLTEYHFFYPYPDYRLMNTLFSDKRLPKAGELVDNNRNFDNDRMQLFDEASAFDQIIEDDVFDLYSNSFVVLIGPDVNEEYARFSNDRANEYAIKTTITKENGVRFVKKQALFLQGDKHILAMKDYEDSLNERYAEGKLKVNKCLIEYENERPVAVFEFVKGKTLSEIMNELVDKGDNDGFMKLFKEYVERIGFNDKKAVSDKDIVFANIIVDGNEWTLIDYEWTVKKAIPTKEIAFRSVYCYLLEHKNANKLNLDLILDELELSQEAADEIRYDEGRFQKQITGNRMAMGELRNLLGHKVYNPVKLSESFSDTEAFYKFQIYRPVDGAFSEAGSYFYENAYIGENKAVVDIDLSADEKIIRLDPLMDSCIVILKECTYNGIAFPVADKKLLMVNGRRIDDNSFVFPTNDPNMEFNLERLPKQAMNRLHVEMDIIRISEEAARKVSSNIKRFF